MTPPLPLSYIHHITMRQQAVAIMYQEVALTVYKALTQVRIAILIHQQIINIKTSLLTLLLAINNTKMETTAIKVL